MARSSSRWDVLFDKQFRIEIASWPADAHDELLARALLLMEFGPSLRRPHADTLQGSKHSNMKELRFAAADGIWRVAFAFDPGRRAILLVGGDKSGTSSRRFCKALIAKADERFDVHLAQMERKKDP
jgi:hypothetical protein